MIEKDPGGRGRDKGVQVAVLRYSAVRGIRSRAGCGMI